MVHSRTVARNVRLETMAVTHPAQAPFAMAFSKYWLIPRPGCSSRGEVVLDPTVFTTLRNPSKYQIRGTYRSSGFLSEGMNNPLADYLDELRRIPYRAWFGEVETNRLWIEVAAQTH